jgi:hypothetical protein
MATKSVPLNVNCPEYAAWLAIRTRCFNIKTLSYKYYGARGITMCESWRDSFIAFYKDMGKRPSKEHSIERIDNNGNYEPGNCKWATPNEQSNNRRNNTYATIKGQTKRVSEWCEIFGIRYNTVTNRIFRGWSLDKDLFSKSRKIAPKRFYTINNKYMGLTEWCKHFGTPYNIAASRIAGGWPVNEELFTTPNLSKKQFKP